ncbi:hypothetical protein ACRYI5_05970 [Furfurilactobacillus sp. WILCCON 0119]
MAVTEAVTRLALIRRDYEQHRPTTFIGDFDLPADTKTGLLTNHLALLCGVIADQSMAASKAWQLPAQLCQRTGQAELTAAWLATHETTMLAAIQQRPALHRFPTTMAHYLSELGRRLVMAHDGDADALLAVTDYQTLLDRLRPFLGVGLKKVNALLLILVLDEHRHLTGLENSQALYDGHLQHILGDELNQRITQKTATAWCQKIDPTFPAQVSPYLWRLDRAHETLQDVVERQTKEAPI